VEELPMRDDELRLQAGFCSPQLRHLLHQLRRGCMLLQKAQPLQSMKGHCPCSQYRGMKIACKTWGHESRRSQG
jgi:hypothetical protein